jgi:hypothetical protein
MIRSYETRGASLDFVTTAKGAFVEEATRLLGSVARRMNQLVRPLRIRVERVGAPRRAQAKPTKNLGHRERAAPRVDLNVGNV